MPSEAIRCSDCGAIFKAVPAWLGNAKVKFTCTNCPKRPSRSVARFEPIPAPAAMSLADPDLEIEPIALGDLEDEPEMELGADDLDDVKDEKE